MLSSKRTCSKLKHREVRLAVDTCGYAQARRRSIEYRCVSSHYRFGVRGSMRPCCSGIVPC